MGRGHDASSTWAGIGGRHGPLALQRISSAGLPRLRLSAPQSAFSRSGLDNVHSAVTGVDHAEAVPLGVGEHDEVRIGRVVPGDLCTPRSISRSTSAVCSSCRRRPDRGGPGDGPGLRVERWSDAGSPVGGGTRIVNSSSASGKRTGSYPSVFDQNETARPTSLAPNTTVPSRSTHTSVARGPELSAHATSPRDVPGRSWVNTVGASGSGQIPDGTSHD